MSLCKSFDNQQMCTFLKPVLIRDIWDETMADKLMYISNDDTQNYPFCRLQLAVETFGQSTPLKSP